MNPCLKSFKATSGRRVCIIMGLLALSMNTFARQGESRFLRRSSADDFSIPEINFEEWILRDPFCDPNLPLLQKAKAASDILFFTKEFRNLYKMKFSAFNFEELRKFSFTINKSVDFLNKFPKFAKKVLPNLSTVEDVQFMENALDMFAVLEKWRHLMLEQMYSHIEELSSSSSFETPANRFDSLLFGFRNHIRNEREYLSKFIRSVLEARIDNVYIPSRYTKGSFPGLDQLMNDLNVTSPAQAMDSRLYRISIPYSEESCIVRDDDSEITIRTPGDRHECLAFRFKNVDNDFFTMEETQKKLSFKFSSSIVKISANQPKEINQFRILKLPNENFIIASPSKFQAFFLGRTTNSNAVKIIDSVCPFTFNEESTEWKIYAVNE